MIDIEKTEEEMLAGIKPETLIQDIMADIKKFPSETIRSALLERLMWFFGIGPSNEDDRRTATQQLTDMQAETVEQALKRVSLIEILSRTLQEALYVELDEIKYEHGRQ